MFDKSLHNGIFFWFADKLAGLSFNGGLMFVGPVAMPADWRDFIKHHAEAPVRPE